MNSLRMVMGVLHLYPEAPVDAQFYPKKLDADGRVVPTPGLVFSRDWPTGLGWFPYLRLSVGGGSDCALLPSGYVGSYLMWPQYQRGRFSFFGGAGVAFGVRKNWNRFVQENRPPSIYRQAGDYEYALTPFGEFDFGWKIGKSTTLVLDMIPGVPQILIFSLGLRFESS